MMRLVMMVGEGEYRSHETMRVVADYAERELGAAVSYCTPDILEDMPTYPRQRFTALDALAEADVLVIFTRFRQLPDEQMIQLTEYLDRGGPVVGLRPRPTPSDIHPTRPGPAGTSASGAGAPRPRC